MQDRGFELFLSKTRLILDMILPVQMGQLAPNVSCVLTESRLIFVRINGPEQVNLNRRLTYEIFMCTS